MENIGCQDEVQRIITHFHAQNPFTMDFLKYIWIQTWFDFHLISMEKGYMAHNPAWLCTTVHLFQLAFYRLESPGDHILCSEGFCPA